MSEALTGIRAKLDRADESLRTFDCDYRRFTKQKPLKVGVDVNFETGWNTAYIEEAESLPSRFGVLIGESLYHGRSALEHLVWALVKANHKKPRKDHTFPIWEKPQRMKGSLSNAGSFIAITKRKELAGVPVAAITLIESLQPYNAPNPPHHFLAILNRMARDDRHHALHASFVGGRGENIERIFRLRRGVHITEFHNLLVYGKSLVHGTKLARFRVTPLTRYPQVRVEGKLPTLVAVGERPAGLLLLADFYGINAHLRQVIGPFKKFL